MSSANTRTRIFAIFAAIVLSGGIPRPVNSQDSGQRAPLLGRVEEIAGGAEPLLPRDLLTGRAYDNAVEQSKTLPLALRGQWDGEVKITQLEIYPDLHPEPYCQQFMGEIKRYFRLGKSGSIGLTFAAGRDGKLTVESSNVRFFRGLAIGLTSQVSPALIPPGTNVPSTIRNDVQELGTDRVEQVRIDYVRIVDQWRRPLHAGFTEVSALYQMRAPKRIRVKILNIDYDQSGKPLWKCLMEGDARRWSSE